MCSLLKEDLPLPYRILAARRHFILSTGVQPTRLVLTTDDVEELEAWLQTKPESPAYLGPPHADEAQIFGMRFRVDQFAPMLHVYFQES